MLRWSVVAAGLLVGCDDHNSTVETTSQVAEPIIGGVDSTTAEDAVVEIAMRPGGSLVGLCSGTAIAPNLVLTARHCVADTDHYATCSAAGEPLVGAVVYDDLAATDLYVYRGVNATQKLVTDSSGAPHAAGRGKQLLARGSTLCNSDVAFLVLDRDLAPPYAPIRLTRTTVGEALTAVGYGLTSAGSLPYTRQRRADVEVLAVGPLQWSSGAGLGDAELFVGESTCSGDSGGPLLSPRTGAVVGVVSRGGGGDGPSGNAAAGCMGTNARAFYTHLVPHQALVASAFAAAGHMVWREGLPVPYAAMGGCESNFDCAAPLTCDSISRTCKVADHEEPASQETDAGAADASAASDESDEADKDDDDWTSKDAGVDASTPSRTATSGDAAVAQAPTSEAPPTFTYEPRPVALSCQSSPGPSGPDAGVLGLVLAALLATRRRR